MVNYWQLQFRLKRVIVQHLMEHHPNHYSFRIFPCKHNIIAYTVVRCATVRIKPEPLMDRCGKCTRPVYRSVISSIIPSHRRARLAANDRTVFVPWNNSELNLNYVDNNLDYIPKKYVKAKKINRYFIILLCWKRDITIL